MRRSFEDLFVTVVAWLIEMAIVAALVMFLWNVALPMAIPALSSHLGVMPYGTMLLSLLSVDSIIDMCRKRYK